MRGRRMEMFSMVMLWGNRSAASCTISASSTRATKVARPQVIGEEIVAAWSWSGSDTAVGILPQSCHVTSTFAQREAVACSVYNSIICRVSSRM
jgi:hypothetical protein